MSVSGFTHCALHVSDLEASIAFYQDYCGMRLANEHGAGPERTVWLASPGSERRFVLVLLGGGPGHTQDQSDMTHYGFAVSAREDIDAIAARAKQEGRLFWEPMAFPPPTGYLCAVRDPDGYVIEFSYGQPLSPDAS
ncbi:VOC family protein [Methyloligella sp. 2.7D]|uniref:VOC family protein n=1 Tax=unclassified Methyloligella TaxID=2625955 RepID=UPI00157C43CC|nr:VOC family protein [Methyloligella sp. GL2]QKP77077.1 VOC family protein [Methyloligella sp. GL2]